MITCSLCNTQLPEDSLFCPSCGTPTSGDQDELLASAASDPTGLLDRVRKVTEGEFTIVRELGRGGMGRVYLAHEIALERRVAMKLLPPARAEQGEIVERFQREARTAGKLHHPNVVPVYQVLERDGLIFFTMPYIAGPNLRQVLRQTPQLGVDVCRRYLREAADALAYAHAQGVVHRDIKPENMLMEGSRDGRLMLTDFGIAKALGTGTTLTRPGDVMGTPYYMSPEQCEEAEDIDGRSDQYSLGLVAYEMLAGRFPLSADSLAGIVYKHLHEYPEPLESVRSDVPLDLRQVIGQSIRKAPAERFESMGALIEALGTPVVRHVAVDAEPSAAGRKPNRRRIGWVAGLAVAVVAIVAGGFVVAQRITSPVNEGDQQLAEILVPPLSVGGAEAGPAAVIDTTGTEPIDSGTPPEGSDEESDTRAGTDPQREASGESGAVDPQAGRENEAERGRAEQARDAAGGSRQTALDARADSVFPDRFAFLDEQLAAAEGALESGELVAAALGFSTSAREFENLATLSQQRLDAAAVPAGPDEQLMPPDTSATVEPEPETPPVPPETAIRALIEEYRGALEAEDFERLARDVYRDSIPRDDADLLSLWMESADSLEITMEYQREPAIDGDRAEVRVKQSMTFLLSSTHAQRDVDINLRMYFQRVGDEWRLERIER
jgi:serine/threonine protein kinase